MPSRYRSGLAGAAPGTTVQAALLLDAVQD